MCSKKKIAQDLNYVLPLSSYRSVRNESQAEDMTTEPELDSISFQSPWLTSLNSTVLHSTHSPQLSTRGLGHWLSLLRVTLYGLKLFARLFICFTSQLWSPGSNPLVSLHSVSSSILIYCKNKDIKKSNRKFSLD